ncbi:PAS domain-containing protein [Methylobacterium sp. J-026]|uniref:PAS domain-containing protein n=1 Tax=Methylobacterium sp. J-026 TaxID=2836624 RepID=UPI001FBAC0D8|nr:PAS domain-containing protein [Methylobacterium sp. J-026]MCJ2137370.1 PAS domain-containing protein [Methylobacterium sp. J-026]
MIFVTDAAGQCVYISQEWTALTGQEAANALGQGWLTCVHQDDRQTVIDTLDLALWTIAEFSMRYRLLKADGVLCWVGSGGVPSFGIEGNRFIGYLGSITELAEGATDTIIAYGDVERFVPPPQHPATRSNCTLDLIADHLILAHTLIEGDGGKEALPDLRNALFKIGRALAARTKQLVRTVN